ncbi:hypothetical protein Terro_3139 [Terriglobus roseus DSM 18391]|uniref:Uncharacterized protein n=1 Tax=Terriglobus roseus (strain DSM 18391 / NRRL B-41598 / KBS 63) TaxID=926566 RepID=I3ZJF0_TERRK|nr:hypothetical protein [Terriglobus roseus]AFL89368.1 hypothetical protein Terro_3139 [Terriglobus roseus DSM 18391]
MNKIFARTLIAGLAVVSAAIAPLVCQAQIRSKSGELVVIEPRSLPEQAQLGGNSFFLHSDDAGSTYLYVEQQEGARLTVFEVTDPSRIKMVSTTPLTVDGPFDFVRALDGNAELVRFRDGKTVALLDLRNAKNPRLHVVSGLLDPGPTEPLGKTGFLGVNKPYYYVFALPRDYQVVDISTPEKPVLLTTIKEVKHRVVNEDTGTTFLLGTDGLTVIRRISVETDYKMHQMQLAN